MRFMLAYLVLAGLAGLGVTAALFLYGSEGPVPDRAWSSWQPQGEASDQPAQISNYVARRYRLPSGDQLVGIVAGPPEVQGVDVRAVAIQEEGDTSADDIEIFPAEASLMYVLCGLGQNCSIRGGEPTQERHRLLRREALELALYTFKYLDGVESVIALLPPPPNTESSGTAVFFQKEDFRRELDRPLEETLARPNPPAIAVVKLSPAESVRIDRLTRPYLFTYEFQQLQEGSAVMVLAPITVQR